jgi:hypothetical protein
MRAASNNTKVLSHEGEKENMNRRILFASAFAAAGFAPIAAAGGEAFERAVYFLRHADTQLVRAGVFLVRHGWPFVRCFTEGAGAMPAQ